MRIWLSLVVLTSWLGTACAAPPAVSREDTAFFETRIRPVLVRRCFDCHGAGIENEAGLNLDSLAAMLTGGRSGPAIKPGNPDNSLLVLAVRHDPTTPQMPPRTKLPLREVADLAEWIRRGAPWPGQDPIKVRPRPVADPDAFPYDQAARDHWAFRPPGTAAVPGFNRHGLRGSIRSPIDRFVLARLVDAGLEPAPETDRFFFSFGDKRDLHCCYGGLS